MTEATYLEAEDVRDRILSGEEVAILDIREWGVFGDGHMLFAVSCPLSHLETRIDDFVPRKDTPVVLCSEGKADRHLVDLGAERLIAWGYTDVNILAGGLDAWNQAGFEVFSGVNVPSKAFGEFVEHAYDTPRIPPEELKAMMDRGEKMIVLDSRPMSEYRKMNIPTGIDCPGAELAYRVHDLAPDPDTTVVVNCAGRTRSIIGAQSLINAGIPNRVVALENGTMGWHLAGYQLEYGNERRFPDLSEGGRAKAEAVRERVAKRFGVPSCDHDQLAAWRAEEGRTTYLLDVRNLEEFTAGHLKGSRHAPGGQLVQAWDRYVAVLGSRIVLVDDDGVRATMTASWLIQMGWPEVYVLENALEGQALVRGPHRPHIHGLDGVQAATVTDIPEAAVVIDLADSLTYRDGHIPGAWFAVRARLKDSIGKIPDAEVTVLTSPDGVLAQLAAPEVGALGRNVVVLEGGTAAWTAAGRHLETGFTHMADETSDVWYRPYDMDDAQEGAMKQYLSWEINLVNQLERDGTTRFRKFPQA
ncbi:MAG: thiosulfate sulfurtransferase [Rhodospirillales bacterium CG15_BIG_FIL_POST_REV_8_21_14_020_66_15]|nr:MAG: thiosulfate sulfurtransferase [Rhodospirillales bacterium CG15_BIG_FIL_POST_REV_8_21_14_020_66_15]